jgi:aspartyl-tRNA(Asn)/glutamyl-tRNA(Gln) amidotransferase subunit A
MIRNSAAEMAAKLAAGETTSVALTQAHLDRITAVDTDVHAFFICRYRRCFSPSCCS